MDGRTVQARICHRDDLPRELYEALASSPEHFFRDQGRIWYMTGETVISCPDDPAGCEMIDAVRMQKRNAVRPQDPVQLFDRIFQDPQFIPDGTLLRTCGVSPEAARGVAVFRAFSPMENVLPEVFADIAPVEREDLVIPVDRQTVAFVRDLRMQTMEDLIEFSDAVIGSMEGEGIAGIHAGVGNAASDLSGIRRSYLEALQALDTGMKYHEGNHVFIYDRQTLERVIDCIPPGKQTEIRRAFYGRCPAGALSDEMMETVSVFFRNDLNLIAASRQLYIHRNTLNYRLDKIRKDFGLDLRSFEDAVIFRIITTIPGEK